MLRLGLLVLATLALVGCEAENSTPAPASSAPAPTTDTQRAAYAASVKFPADAQAKSDLPLAAVANPAANSIKIYNYSTQPLRDVNLWINQAFVAHINAIPGHGNVTVHTGDFYNSLGSSLFTQKQDIRQLQLQTGGALYNVWGPLPE